MIHDNDDTDGVPDLSNRKLLEVLMQEIVDVRRELKQDIADSRSESKRDIASMDQKFSGKFDALSSSLHLLKLELHQNQSTFILNHADLEQRVTVLEAA